jgi:hypothetical protein
MRGMRCPKCSSAAVSGSEYMNLKWSSTAPDCKVHCMMCGFILYGDQARHFMATAKQAELARIEQEQRFEEELRAERTRKAEQLPPPPAVIIIPVEITKCAWHKCSEPKRATSIYCSSKCRVSKAHANEWERRKAAKKASADISSVQGVSSDRASA